MKPEMLNVKKPKLTKKQKGFAKEYARTGNGTQSALKHYDTKDDDTAAAIAYENLSKPQVAQAIEIEEKSLADSIPNELLTEKHLALLNKKEVKRTFNAEIGEWIEVETGDVETAAVSKGLELAYKLKKVIGTDQPAPQTGGGNTYNFLFTAEAQAEIASFEEKLKAKILGYAQPDQTGLETQ